MGPEGIILVNPPITTLQQSLTHSAVKQSQGKDLFQTNVFQGLVPHTNDTSDSKAQLKSLF